MNSSGRKKECDRLRQNPAAVSLQEIAGRLLSRSSPASKQQQIADGFPPPHCLIQQTRARLDEHLIHRSKDLNENQTVRKLLKPACSCGKSPSWHGNVSNSQTVSAQE